MFADLGEFESMWGFKRLPKIEHISFGMAMERVWDFFANLGTIVDQFQKNWGRF